MGWSGITSPAWTSDGGGMDLNIDDNPGVSSMYVLYNMFWLLNEPKRLGQH